MADMSRHLSEQEQRYLRRLFAQSKSADAADYVELMVPEFGSELLLTALGQLDSELVASDGRYYLRFKLEVVTDRLAGVRRLRLSLPVVTDRDGVERAARVRPVAGEVTVADPRGRLADAEVLDISNTGIALRPSQQISAAPGAHMLGLKLHLPEQRPVVVDGRVVRVQRDGSRQRLALCFEHAASDVQRALLHYVFDRYSGLPRQSA